MRLSDNTLIALALAFGAISFVIWRNNRAIVSNSTASTQHAAQAFADQPLAPFRRPPLPRGRHQIIVFGVSGSGTSTQIQALADELNLVRIDLKDVVRENITQKTKLGLEAIAELELNGNRNALDLSIGGSGSDQEQSTDNDASKSSKSITDGIPDILLERMVEQKMDLAHESNCKRGWVLTGFPSTVRQLRIMLDARRPDTHVPRACFFLHCPSDDVVTRVVEQERRRRGPDGARSREQIAARIANEVKEMENVVQMLAQVEAMYPGSTPVAIHVDGNRSVEVVSQEILRALEY